MNFTDNQQDILYRAWLLSRTGHGQVLEQWLYPDAVPLEEAGWLERRYVDQTGDWSWFWTPKGRDGAGHERVDREHPGP
jgi:hypothetical protein